jgi:branched-chain amino acid transport system permease protein
VCRAANTELVAAGTWMLGGMLSGLSGVLLISFLGLDTPAYELAFIASFAAAVIARMRSMAVTFLAALVLGVVQETSTDYLPSGAVFVGLRTCIPFFIMIIALVAYNFIGGNRAVSSEAASPLVLEATTEVGRSTRWRAGRLAPGGIGVVALLLLPVLMTSFWLNLTSIGISLGVIFLSYTIIVGMGGMISLAQLSFAAIGALATTEFATFDRWPVLPSILLGGLVVVPVGVVVALPAMRWARLYLALGTLAFAFLVDNLVFTYPRYNNYGSGVQLGRPSIGSLSLAGNTAFFYFALAAFAVVAAGVVRLRRSTAGLLFTAIRESERATVTTGYGLFGPKIALFAISSFVAGIGGGIYATSLGQVVPSTYNATLGIVLLAVIVTVGTRSVWAALIAGVVYSLLPAMFNFYLSATWQQVPAILFGLGAIGLAREPRGALVHATLNVQKLRARIVGRGGAPPEDPNAPRISAGGGGGQRPPEQDEVAAPSVVARVTDGSQ